MTTRSRSPHLLGTWFTCLLVLSGTVGAQPFSTEGPVPTFAEVTGHDFGERITTHAETVAYLERLAETSDRVSLIEQGESWEGRRLLAAVVTSPANHARLAEIRANAGALGHPERTSPEEAEGIIEAGQPVVAWLGGSIHGFELSGTEGLLRLVEHLTTRDDEETRAVLDRVVTIVDPILNPDGRDAFAHANHRAIGATPNPARDDWANDFTFWDALAYRTGHYFFDTNRDWFAHTQRETRNRIPTLLSWRPQIVVDAHEMGADVEFFFDPPADPFTGAFPPYARDWFERFNRAYAEAFDEAGFEYMTRERYNYFYPGYTTSYGSFQGAVGMLYEQGSSRGLALERADESVRTLGDALTQQYTAARAAVGLAASERAEILAAYHRALRAATDGTAPELAGAPRRYLLPPPGGSGGPGDPGLHRELGDLLARNGIEVGVLESEARVGGLTGRTGEAVGERSFPAGTLVVSTRQPLGRLADTLLAPDQPLPAGFLEGARRRVDRDENPRFYDITTWSLPLLFDLEAYSTNAAGELATRRLEAEPTAAAGWPGEGLLEGAGEAGAEIPRAGYAYLFPGSQTAAMAALHHLKEEGLRAAVTLRPALVGERELPTGTVVVRVGQNDEGVHEAVRDAARRYGLEVVPVDTGLATLDPTERPEGLASPTIAAFGSGDVLPVRESEIALLAGHPVHAYSFGWTWYVLDRQYGIPVTVRNVPSMGETPIDRFDVLVLPDTFSAEGLAGALGEGGRERIARWVRDGGTLVAIGASVDLVRRHLDLIELGSFYPESDPGEEGDGEAGDEEAERPYAYDVPGAILAVDLDPESWLAAGYSGSAEIEAGATPFPALVNSSRIFIAPEGPPDASRRVVGRYTEGDRLLLSGHAWEESLERLPGAVFLYDEEVGSGRVVAFSEDPSFRAYWRGADRLLLNAVVLGPSVN